MVEYVDESVSVDRQGRLVVPAHLRENLGIKDGGRLILSQDGRKLVLEPVDIDVRTLVNECEKKTKESSIPMNTEKPRTSGKWMSDEYARKKIGLLSGL